MLDFADKYIMDKVGESSCIFSGIDSDGPGLSGGIKSAKIKGILLK